MTDFTRHKTKIYIYQTYISTRAFLLSDVGVRRIIRRSIDRKTQEKPWCELSEAEQRKVKERVERRRRLVLNSAELGVDVAVRMFRRSMKIKFSIKRHKRSKPEVIVEDVQVPENWQAMSAEEKRDYLVRPVSSTHCAHGRIQSSSSRFQLATGCYDSVWDFEFEEVGEADMVFV